MNAARLPVLRARSAAIGLTLTPVAVTAVAVRGERVVWTERVALSSDVDVAQALSDLVPRAAGAIDGRRVRLFAAVSASYAQVKAIHGFPRVRPRTLAEAVRANQRQFFATSAEKGIIGGVRRSQNLTWAASYDAGVVAALKQVAERVKVSGLELAPAVAVLAQEDWCERTYVDDGILVSAQYDVEGRLTEVRRSVARAGDSGAPTLDGDLASTAALLAITRAGRDAVTLTVAMSDRAASQRRRLILAGSLAVACGLGAIVIPAWLAVRERNTAEAALRALAAKRVAAATAASELASASTGVNELASFDAGRRSTVLLLSGVAAALPPGSAIADFHADTVGGTMVVVALRSADVLDALSRLDVLASPTILGPVTHEQVPAATGTPASPATQYERMTVQFRFPENGS